MNLIDRAKSILTTPKTEWIVIDSETATPQSLLTSYVVPMALIGTVAAFIGYGFVGLNVFGIKVGGINWGIAQGLTYFVSTLVSFFIASYVIDALAPNFGSEKNINKSAKLVAYASTASYVAAVFAILPSLSFLAILGLYSVYLFYVGLPILKRTAADKVIAYMIVSALVIIVVGFVVNFILMKIVYTVLGNPYTVNGLLGT